MRVYSFAGLAAAVLVGVLAGCQSSREEVHEVWVREHFQGLGVLATRPDLAPVQNLIALPASQAILDHVVTGLANDLPTWFGSATPRPTEAAGLVPLMRTLLTGESYLEVHGRKGEVSSWALASRLAPADSARLGTELGKTLATALGATAPTSPTGWELRAANGGGDARFAAVGAWTIFGRGPSALEELRARVTAQGAPVAPSTNYVLRVVADTGALAKVFGWGEQPVGPVDQWPQVDLTLEPRKGRLRSSATLDFARPLGLTLEPWRLPTHVMRDPLVGFTAMQGADTWLKRLETLKPVEGATWPRQAFYWSMAGEAWLQYFAAPLSQPTNLMSSVAAVLPTKLMPRVNLGNSVFGLRVTNNATLMQLHGLLWFEPFLQATRNQEAEMIFGGLFPHAGKAQPPQGLLQQVQGRTNLVFYDWEITGRSIVSTNPPSSKRPPVETNFLGRLVQFRDLAQFGKLLLATNASLLPSAKSGGLLVPGADWIRSAGPLLGETITEVTLASPTRLSLVRQSQLGVGSYELMHLLRWLENPGFPGWKEETAPAAAPARAGLAPAGPAAPITATPRPATAPSAAPKPPGAK